MRAFIRGVLGFAIVFRAALANAEPPPPAPAPVPVPAAVPVPVPVPAPVPAAVPVPVPVPVPAPAPLPPPPPGYAYAYGYPLIPLAPLKPEFPDDSSVRSSPFADLIAASMGWDHRFSEGVSVGAQAGAYVEGVVRLTAKIAFLTETVRDDQEDRPGRSSKAPSFFWGGTAGIVAYHGAHFAFSPGILFMRTNVGDYGTMAGLSLPFEWTLDSGVRIGLEAAGGRAFGGQSAVPCSSNCNSSVTFEDRLAGPAGWLQFQVGFGLNHPSPLPPRVAPPLPAQ